MNKIIFYVLGLLIFIGCMYKYILIDKKRNTKPYNTVISINNEQPNISLIQKKIKPLIDEIIRSETKNNTDLEFRIKPRHDITLYYLNDFIAGNEEFIENILKDIASTNPKINNIEISENLDFFGDANELVILIKNDNQLNKLNIIIKESLANSNFYNKENSEKFQFTPHITLGRLPKNSSFEGNIDQQNQIVARIKNRIINEVFPIMINIIKNNNKLKTSKISFYKLTKDSFTINI